MKNHRNIDVWLERGCHLTAVGLSVTAAFLLRFDFTIPAGVLPILKQALLIAILVKLPIFDWVGFYRSLRRFASIPDLYLVFLGNVAGSVLFAAVTMFWIGPAMPRSVLVWTPSCAVWPRHWCAFQYESVTRPSGNIPVWSAPASSSMELAARVRSWFAKSIPTVARGTK